MTITELLVDLEAKAKQATPGPWYNTQILEVERVEESLPSDVSAPRITRSYIHMVGPRKPFGLSPTGYTDEYIARVGANDADYIAACSPDRTLALVAYVRTLEQVARAAANHIHDIPLGADYITVPVLDCEICQTLITLAAHLDAEEEKA